MLCPTCQTEMALFAGNRERHYVCMGCSTTVDRTPFTPERVHEILREAEPKVAALKKRQEESRPQPSNLRLEDEE